MPFHMAEADGKTGEVMLLLQSILDSEELVKDTKVTQSIKESLKTLMALKIDQKIFLQKSNTIPHYMSDTIPHCMSDTSLATPLR